MSCFRLLLIEMSLSLREANPNDLNEINQIYNYYVLNSTATAQESPDDFKYRIKWFNGLIAKGLPVIVAEINEKLVGWGSLCMFNERSAYRFCCENTVYVDKDHLSSNIGSAIMEQLLSLAKQKGFKTMFAKINCEQQKSIDFHQKFGFRKVGLLENATFKFNRFASVCIMQKDLDQ